MHIVFNYNYEKCCLASFGADDGKGRFIRRTLDSDERRDRKIEFFFHAYRNKFRSTGSLCTEEPYTYYTVSRSRWQE